LNNLIPPAVIIIGLGVAYYFLYNYNYNEAKGTMSLVMPNTLAYAQNQHVYDVTWEECVDFYDEITCAVLEQELVEDFGKSFNHTESNQTTEIAEEVEESTVMMTTMITMMMITMMIIINGSR
jgi:hypothetical protein